MATKRRSYTDAELIWLAYCRCPPDIRRCASFEEMTERAKEIWLDIARRDLANGWQPAVETTYD